MNINDIKNKKKNKQKIVMLTAYDYSMARLIDQTGVDIILVGDSLANVVLGLKTTKEVGMMEMIHHTKAVRRAVKNSLLVGDMPFKAYQKNPKAALKNAQRFIKEAGCDAVKIEWFDQCLNVVEQLVKAKIPVMGHVGLTPQTAKQMKVQGKDVDSAKEIIKNAQLLEKFGCFSIVLECIPTELAKIITQKLKIPTIGIGAGPFCDGQVLVMHDMLGLFDGYIPKFAKRYAQLGKSTIKAVSQYSQEVRSGKFPNSKFSFSMKNNELKDLK